MSIKTCLAEIKPSDFEAIRSGLIGVVQQEGENLVISRFITNMEEARTPEQRAFALDYLSTDLQLSFPVSVALDLGDGSYRGFERCMNRLRETGWMGRYFADWEPYIQSCFLECETAAQIAKVTQILKTIRRTSVLLRRALSLAGIPDNYETFLESARDSLAA